MAWKQLTSLRPALLKFNNNYVTDHNRSPLDISIERIENSQRTANGTLRKNVIADKHSFQVSWTMVPHNKEYTVDAGFGGGDIYDFYMANTGSFTLSVGQMINPSTYDGTNNSANNLSIVTYNVVFTDCSFEIVKRHDPRVGSDSLILMDVSIGMEEV
jgi:hypothetical protein